MIDLQKLLEELERVKSERDGEREMKESQFNAHSKCREELERVKRQNAAMREAAEKLRIDLDCIAYHAVGPEKYKCIPSLVNLANKFIATAFSTDAGKDYVPRSELWTLQVKLALVSAEMSAIPSWTANQLPKEEWRAKIEELYERVKVALDTNTDKEIGIL